VIIAVALFWADLVKSILHSALSSADISSPVMEDLIIAAVATILGCLVLVTYRRIKSRLHKVKVP
jgi:hypothetical protein